MLCRLDFYNKTFSYLLSLFDNQSIIRVSRRATELEMLADSSGDITDKKSSDYACEHCPKTFPSRRLYSIHMKIHIRPHECDICGHRFARQYGLTAHRKAHLGEKDFHCSLCGQSFTLRQQLLKHESDLHSESFEIQCGKCSGHFKNEKLLKIHEMYFCESSVEKTTERFDCTECGKLFLSIDDLKNHSRFALYIYYEQVHLMQKLNAGNVYFGKKIAIKFLS